jgi:hypothetical protein
MPLLFSEASAAGQNCPRGFFKKMMQTVLGVYRGMVFQIKALAQDQIWPHRTPVLVDVNFVVDADGFFSITAEKDWLIYKKHPVDLVASLRFTQRVGEASRESTEQELPKIRHYLEKTISQELNQRHPITVVSQPRLGTMKDRKPKVKYLILEIPATNYASGIELILEHNASCPELIEQITVQNRQETERHAIRIESIERHIDDIKAAAVQASAQNIQLIKKLEELLNSEQHVTVTYRFKKIRGNPVPVMDMILVDSDTGADCDPKFVEGFKKQLVQTLIYHINLVSPIKESELEKHEADILQYLEKRGLSLIHI